MKLSLAVLMHEDVAALETQFPVDYEIGWKAEQVPRNMDVPKRLSVGSNPEYVASTFEPSTPVKLDYLANALQAQLRENKDLFLSLDPSATPTANPMQIKKVDPECLASRGVGNVHFPADSHLKELSMGVHEQPVIGKSSCSDYREEEDRNKENHKYTDAAIAAMQAHGVVRELFDPLPDKVLNIQSHYALGLNSANAIRSPRRSVHKVHVGKREGLPSVRFPCTSSW